MPTSSAGRPRPGWSPTCGEGLFRGDDGPAVANIRPHYTLSVDTTSSDAVCAVKDVDLNVNFVMTLPQARMPGAFSPGTRTAWFGFVDFARRHEETHRTIYIDCADSLATRIEQLTTASCTQLRAGIDTMFRLENRACEQRQRGFDRGEYRKLLRLSLFSGSRHARHRVPTHRHGLAPFSAMAAPPR